MRIKPQALIGVEFSSNSVRIIKTNSKSCVIRAGRVELPAGAHQSDETARYDSMLATLKQAKKKARIGGGKCVLCLSGSDIILRHFVVPNMDEQGLKINIDHEIQDFIAGDKYYVTHKIQSYTIGADGAAQLKILVAAALQSKVEEQLKMLRAAGLKPVRVDVSENSREKLINYFTDGAKLTHLEPPKLTKGKKKKKSVKNEKTSKKPEKTKEPETPPDVNAAIITFGTSVTSVMIVLGRRFYVSRYLNTGSREIIERISETEGVDMEKASALFLEGDFFSEDADSDNAVLVRNMLDTLGAEISSVIDYSFYRERTHKVDKIYVSGPISRLNGAIPYLEDVFGIPVAQIMLTEQFKKRSRVDDASPFINVLGATLREVRSK